MSHKIYMMDPKEQKMEVLELDKEGLITLLEYMFLLTETGVFQNMENATGDIIFGASLKHLQERFPDATVGKLVESMGVLGVCIGEKEVDPLIGACMWMGSLFKKDAPENAPELKENSEPSCSWEDGLGRAVVWGTVHKMEGELAEKMEAACKEGDMEKVASLIRENKVQKGQGAEPVTDAKSLVEGLLSLQKILTSQNTESN